MKNSQFILDQKTNPRKNAAFYVKNMFGFSQNSIWLQIMNAENCVLCDRVLHKYCDTVKCTHMKKKKKEKRKISSDCMLFVVNAVFF